MGRQIYDFFCKPQRKAALKTKHPLLFPLRACRKIHFFQKQSRPIHSRVKQLCLVKK